MDFFSSYRNRPEHLLRKEFVFTTAEVAQRISRSTSTVTKYAREWPEVKHLCCKISGRWMWHEDCFEVFRKLGVGRMTIHADFIDTFNGGLHQSGGIPTTTSEQLTALVKLIIYYHKRREIPDNAFKDMERFFRRE